MLTLSSQCCIMFLKQARGNVYLKVQFFSLPLTNGRHHQDNDVLMDRVMARSLVGCSKVLKIMKVQLVKILQNKRRIFRFDSLGNSLFEFVFLSIRWIQGRVFSFCLEKNKCSSLAFSCQYSIEGICFSPDSSSRSDLP